jgi:hypothetical protein
LQILRFQEFTAIPNKSKCFSALHLNIVSLGLHFDDLSTLLDHLQHSFGVIAITETKFTSTFPSINFSLPNFSTEHTPTESSAGGALLYISNKFTYKPRTDLTKAFYHSKLLESIFVELTQPRKKNIVVGSVYRHPKMSIDDFNYNYLSPLLDKVSSENKTLILLGDFNVDLLKSNTDHNISNFLDILGSNSVLPAILLPTRITATSKTLIDNAFISASKFNTVSGNIIYNISDHLPQFILLRDPGSLPQPKSHILKRDWSKFDEENFILDYLKIDWDIILKLENKNANYSFEVFYSTISSLIDQHVPLIQLTKKQKKFLSKPWITSGIRNSIYKRDSLFKHFISASNPILKSSYHENYKKYRNLIVSLCRRSKFNYYSEYFRSNINNTHKIWQGVRDIISLGSSK